MNEEVVNFIGLNKAILVGKVIGEVTKIQGYDGIKFRLITTDLGNDERLFKAYHTVMMWKGQEFQQLAELKNDALVSVQGRISYRKVGEGNDVRYFTDIVANNMDVKVIHSTMGIEASVAPKKEVARDESDTIPF